MECLFGHFIQRITFLTTFFINGTRIPAENSGSSSGWCSLGSAIGFRAVFSFRGKTGQEGQSLPMQDTDTGIRAKARGAFRAYMRGANLEQ